MTNARRLVSVVACLSLAVLFGGYMPEAHSACAAPEIWVTGHGPYQTGDVITIRGKYWTGSCNDTVVCTTGCLGRSSCSRPEPAEPAEEIHIALANKAYTTRLADGLTGLSFALDVKLPNVPTGTYRIVGSSPATGSWRSDPIQIVGGR
jgi:hypothetical protein